MIENIEKEQLQDICVPKFDTESSKSAVSIVTVTEHLDDLWLWLPHENLDHSLIMYLSKSSASPFLCVGVP